MATRTTRAGKRAYRLTECEDCWPATPLLARGEAWSVTTILSVLSKADPLMWWAAMQERDACCSVMRELAGQLPEVVESRIRSSKLPAFKTASREATDLGSQAHARIEWISKGSVGSAPAIVEGAELAVMAWEDWMRTSGAKVLRSELTVYSRTQRYAGTTDAIMQLDAGQVLVDYKSSKAIYRESEMQVAAYRAAAIEMGIIDSSARAAVIRLPKTLEQVDEEPIEVRILKPKQCEKHMRYWPGIMQSYEWTRLKGDS